MRWLTLITFFTATAFAQTPDPIQTLLGEVQQLRLAIERSTLLGARTQIALQRIQIQETRTKKLEQEAGEYRDQADSIANNRSGVEARAKDIEEQLRQAADPKERPVLEEALRKSKESIASLGPWEQQVRAKETEVITRLRVEESRLQDLLSRVDEMERAIDAAIRQITEKK